MSWINSNATYKQNSKNDLSFYHGFSKTPVEPTSTGTAATTLANASTKGGHTVIGTEVWAEEIPWFGLVPSRAVAVTRLSGLAKLNDLVKVDGEGGKVYKYIGADDATFTEAQWSSFWQEVTLTNGMTLNNRHNQPVLRYYLNQPMQTLTTTNNASIDSKGYATRLFVNESDHTGQASGGSVVSQFAAGTDNIKNGIPSVELNPKLYYNTTEKIAGTHYYDYNVSGTVLWNENVTSKGVKISCFRYIGKTVTGQLSTVDSTVKSHSLDIADIKLALGMNPNPDSPTTSVTARVETVEDVVRTLLGLGSDAPIAATESISATANSAATNAINSALADGGSIAQKITSAISALGDVAVKSDIKISEIKVKSGSTTTTLTPDSNKSVTVEIPEVQAATTSVAGVVTISDNDAIATTETSTAAATVAAVAATRSAIAGELGALAGTVSSNKTEVDGKISAIEGKLASTGEIGQAIADVKATADSAVQSVTKASGSSALLTVTDGTNATISLSTEVATKTDAANAASTAITTSLSGTTAGTIGAAVADAKKAGTDAATAANAKVADVTVDGTSIVSGAAGSKTAALTTTKGVEITPSATSASTALATEASVAKALASINSVGVSYEVIPDGQTHTSITAPVKGRIYLEKDTTNAEAGVYIEWMYTEKGWEQIGSTKTDHSSYASTITVNGSPKTVANSAVDLGAFASTVATGQATTLANQGSVYANIANNGTLTLGVASATDSVMGVSKMFTSDLWNDIDTDTASTVTDTAVSVKSARKMYSTLAALADSAKNLANSKVAGVIADFYLGLAGIAVTESNSVVNISDTFVRIKANELALEAKSVINGVVTTNRVDEPYTKRPIATSKIVNGASMFEDSMNLTTWVDDLECLTSGYAMFAGCSNLTTFIGDLGALTNGKGMFRDCQLSLESVEYISDTINDVTELTNDETDDGNAKVRKQFDFGYSVMGSEMDALNTAIAEIKAKGWTVYANKQLK